jgi:hypothetical protein
MGLLNAIDLLEVAGFLIDYRYCKRSNASFGGSTRGNRTGVLLIGLFGGEDSDAFHRILFFSLSKDNLELRI